jgi:chromosome segregation ATPase
MQSELAGTTSARDEAQALLAESQRENGDLQNSLRQAHDDLNGLREERKEVKQRIERLLGQLDVLGGS